MRHRMTLLMLLAALIIIAAASNERGEAAASYRQTLTNDTAVIDMSGVRDGDSEFGTTVYLEYDVTRKWIIVSWTEYGENPLTASQVLRGWCDLYGDNTPLCDPDPEPW